METKAQLRARLERLDKKHGKSNLYLNPDFCGTYAIMCDAPGPTSSSDGWAVVALPHPKNETDELGKSRFAYLASAPDMMRLIRDLEAQNKALVGALHLHHLWHDSAQDALEYAESYLCEKTEEALALASQEEWV